jgi:hypothetical protein
VPLFVNACPLLLLTGSGGGWRGFASACKSVLLAPDDLHHPPQPYTPEADDQHDVPDCIAEGEEGALNASFDIGMHVGACAPREDYEVLQITVPHCARGSTS